MYNFFCRNLSNYLKLTQDRSDYRSQISQVLRGLLDKKVYDAWQYEQPMLYAELNNLIFCMGQKQDEYVLFHTLVWDLWALDFNAVEDSRFDMEIIKDQLNIIDLCVKGMYLDMEIREKE